eukprot:180719_1
MTSELSKSRKRRERRKKLRNFRNTQVEDDKKRKKLTCIQDVELVPFITACIEWLKMGDDRNMIKGAILKSDLSQIIVESNLFDLIVEYTKGPPTEQQFNNFIKNGYKQIVINEFNPDELIICNNNNNNQDKACNESKRKCLTTLIKQRNALINLFKNGGIDLSYSYFGLETEVGTWYNWNIDIFTECANVGLYLIQRNKTFYQGTYNDDQYFSWIDIEWWFKMGQSRE